MNTDELCALEQRIFNVICSPTFDPSTLLQRAHEFAHPASYPEITALLLAYLNPLRSEAAPDLIETLALDYSPVVRVHRLARWFGLGKKIRKLSHTEIIRELFRLSKSRGAIPSNRAACALYLSGFSERGPIDEGTHHWPEEFTQRCALLLYVLVRLRYGPPLHELKLRRVAP